MALTTTTRNRITEMIGARPSDCTPAMWDVFGVLRGVTGAATVTGIWSYAEIAGLANCTPSTARKAIRELHERGYIAVYDTAHANRYRLSAGDCAAAERMITRLTDRTDTATTAADTPATPDTPTAPMDGIRDAADRLAFPGRPMHGRRTPIRPARVGTRLVTDHDTPRGRVFRLVPVRAGESARALMAAMAEDRGEIRVGAFLPGRKNTRGDDGNYRPKHLATDDRPRWQRMVAPVGLGLVIAASLTMLGVTAANTHAAETTVPEPKTWLTGPTWKTVDPGIDEPTENKSRRTNDDMRGYTPTPAGEAEAAGEAAEITLPGIVLEDTPRAPEQEVNPIEELAGESATTATEATTASPYAVIDTATTTTVTDANGTVWEIGADGTVLGVIQGGAEGGYTAGPAPEDNTPPVGECMGPWEARDDVDGTVYYTDSDGNECVPPSNRDGEAPTGDVNAPTVPEQGETPEEAF